VRLNGWQRFTSHLNTLNGWQRVGAVLSALWIFVILSLAAYEFSFFFLSMGEATKYSFFIDRGPVTFESFTTGAIAPRWPLQIPPSVATSNSPSGDDRSVWIVALNPLVVQGGLAAAQGYPRRRPLPLTGTGGRRGG
jgi:hypothetical protein